MFSAKTDRLYGERVKVRFPENLGKIEHGPMRVEIRKRKGFSKTKS